jgi:hypothetical protein
VNAERETHRDTTPVDHYLGKHRKIPPIVWRLGNRTERPHSPNGWDNGR